MVAVLPQTIHDVETALLTFQFLEKIYTSSTVEQRTYLIECGLLPSVTKALSKFCQKWGTTQEKCLDSIQMFLLSIAHKAILTAGTINVHLSSFFYVYFSLIIFFLF